MKKYFVIVFLMFISVASFWLVRPPKLAKSVSSGPQIIIVQIKITSSNGQFITLYNNTNAALDLSTIQLQYFNNYDLLKATTGKLISLSGKVPARGYAVVDDGPIQACHQMTVNSVSLGLSSTAGFVQVSHFFGTASPQVVSALDDYIGWSKTAASGAQTLPASTSAFLQRQSTGGQDYSSIGTPGSGTWTQVAQPDGSSPCDSSAAAVASGGNSLTASLSPVPFSTVLSATDVASAMAIPDSDAGLAAPQISEVLPNPVSPQTDANDEFIELYNSNGNTFDLSDFILQVGTTTIHKYVFPGGTHLDPHQFMAFYSSDTGLSLSNSDGQVKLLEPGGNVLGQSDEYGTAKDGYAWVSSDGLWQWTTTPTPNAANIITAPPVSKTAAAKTTSGTSKKTSKTAKAVTASPSTSSLPPGGTPASSLHPAILAGIGGLAVIYALYEYRNDLANQLYKLRRNRAARRVAG